MAEPNIQLNGVQKIDGNLDVTNNTALTSLSADSLSEIAGTFTLAEIPNLNTVNFPKLKTVDGLRFVGLPNLQNLGFDAEITKANIISIENTQLQSLQGINIETVKNMFIANNRYVTTIDMQLGNISEALTLSANPEAEVMFPNLIWANNMTFRNCSKVSIPSVVALNDSLNLIGNTFESFFAPNLTEVGGALALVSNSELTNISFPLLTEVGDNLQIANNTKLDEIAGLPKLKTISGALDFNGNMSKYVLRCSILGCATNKIRIELPALADVKGAFNIQSTGDVQKTCDDTFSPLHKKGKIQGNFVCVGRVENPGGEGSTPTVTGNGPKKTGAASAVHVQAGALLAGLAAVFFL
jgi:hypothetical protein